MKSRVLVLLMAVCAMLAACVGSRHDSRLDTVAAIVSDRPEEAMLRLDSIGYPGLSEPDLHLYDLLSIKAADKAYIRHTSDSLILDVIDWYGSHRETGLYPEALYYGGRVYSDLGDYPTAIKYFHEALDAIPTNKENLKFRSNVLSQTGRLLWELRVYSEAISYLNESNKIDALFPDDAFGIAYNHHLIASAYLYSNKLDSARFHMDEAIRYSALLPAEDQANIKVGMGQLFLEEGKIDSALNIIRPLPYEVDSVCLNYSLANACEIYLAAGIKDTAYMYARQLISSESPENRKTAFRVIFSDKLSDYVSEDTLRSLIKDYRNVMEEYINNHEVQSALIHNANYNYDLHVKARKNAEESKARLLIVLLAITTVCAILFATVMYYIARNAKLAVKFGEALNLIKKLKEEQSHSTEPLDPELLKYKADEFAEKKRKMLADFEFPDDLNLQLLVPKEILQSGIYNILLNKISSNKGITDKENVWKELEDIIEQNNPGFKYRLMILTDGKMSESDLQISLLIRCGFTTTQIAILLNRMKNTVSSRRSYLAKRIFGKTATAKMLDAIIYSL